MKISPLPKNEIERLAAIKNFHLLDTDEEKDFDDIVVLASQICNTPISVITLVDEKRQWFKAKKNWAFKETDRTFLFCAHTIHYDDIMMIPDTLQDERFVDNPLVIEEPAIRFYAGVPLITSDGYILGTLAVIDRKPGTLTEEQLSGLRILGRQVVNLLNLRLYLLQQDSCIKEKTDEATKIFERITDAFVALDKNWCYTYMNKKAGEILGRDTENMIGKYIWSDMPEGIDLPFYKAYHRAMEEQKYIYVEEYYPPYDKWFENHIYPSPEGLSIFFRDISEKKKSEETIKKEKELSDSVIKSLPGIFYMSDLTPKLLRWNKAFETYTGYSAEELGKIVPITVFDPKDHPALRQAIEKTYKEGLADAEAHILTKNGKKIPFYFTGVRMEYGGKPAMLGTGIDITGIKKAEEEIKESIERYELLSSATNDAVWEWNLQTKKIWGNDRFYQLYGLSREKDDLNKLEPYAHAHPDDISKLKSSFAEALENKAASITVEFRFRMPGGNYNTFLDRAFIQYDDTGNPLRIIGAMLDITESKKKELILAGEKKVMEMIAMGKPLKEVLNTIALNYESVNSGAICSVLLLDEYGVHLRHGAAPALPADYNKAVDGLAIGKATGSCGTSAYTKKPVIVSDIANDPLWFDYRELALGFGLKACWSTPILNNKQVLGTFGIYYKEIRKPVAEDLIFIERATNQVKIVLERYYKEALIKESEEKYRTLVEQASDGIIQIDEQGKIILVNTAICRMLGYTEEEFLKKSIEDTYAKKDKHLAGERLQLVKESGTLSYERMMIKKDGTEVPVEFSVSKTRAGQFLGIVRDIADRKKAEEAIRISEVKYRNVVENIHESLIVEDVEGKLIYANNEFSKMFGFSQDELINLSLKDYITQESYAEIIGRHNRRMKGGKESDEFEYKGRRKDGTEIWIECRVSTLIENGKIIGTQSLERDITERKKIEEEIKEKATQLQTMSDNLPGAMMYQLLREHNGEMRFIYVSKSVIKFTGHSPEEVIENPAFLYGIAYEEDWSITAAAEEASFRNMSVFNVEVRSKNLSGEQGWVHIRSIPRKLADGRVIWDGIMTDITERKKAEKALSESENRLRTILETEPECVKILGLKGELLSMNPAGLAMIEADNEEQVVGHQMTELVNKKYRIAFKRLTKEVFKGNSGTLEFEITGLKGCRRWLETHAVPLKDAEGKVISLLGVTRDITERKKNEEEIKNANEQLRQLAAHLQTIREEERKRIGREIHDELGQQLTAVKMDVVWIDKKIPEETIAVKTKLNNIITLLDGSNESIRKILNELRHGILEDNGLLEALEWQGNQFTEITGIPVKFVTKETVIELPVQIGNCIFRVYQESLTNIMRYAHASKVISSLRIDDDNIIFTVEDNGKGFDTLNVQSKKSFGILGMKERVHSFNGKFTLGSVKEKGTKMMISLPYKTKIKI